MDVPTPPTYEEKPAFKTAMFVGLQAGVVGAFVSAVQNALDTHSRGGWGFLTRTGSTIGTFAAMGATFALTEGVVANHRQTDDAVNGMVGGCAAGFLAGVRARSLPVAITSCAIIGAAVGTFDYAGNFTKAALPLEVRREAFFKQRKPPTATTTTTTTEES